MARIRLGHLSGTAPQRLCRVPTHSSHTVPPMDAESIDDVEDNVRAGTLGLNDLQQRADQARWSAGASAPYR
jgi:soluble lytic murein transglycosylase-like protein